jgi:(S)-2-hydroxyglutarate dehydrogenase
VIGGGIIGVTITKALAAAFPSLKICLLEKESKLGMHTSTRNSSVIHSGIYYATDSLKAKFTIRGNQMLT